MTVQENMLFEMKYDQLSYQTTSIKPKIPQYILPQQSLRIEKIVFVEPRIKNSNQTWPQVHMCGNIYLKKKHPKIRKETQKPDGQHKLNETSQL